MGQFSEEKKFIEIRVCPECGKAFYAPVDRAVCPHCRYVFLERRYKGRIKKELAFTVSLEGKKLPARLEDYSENGIKMVYKGAGLEVDTVLHVNIDEMDLHRNARAVWTKKLSKSLSSSGLKLL